MKEGKVIVNSGVENRRNVRLNQPPKSSAVGFVVDLVRTCELEHCRAAYRPKSISRFEINCNT